MMTSDGVEGFGSFKGGIHARTGKLSANTTVRTSWHETIDEGLEHRPADEVQHDTDYDNNQESPKKFSNRFWRFQR